jgi:hypothetical protein
MQMFVSLTRIVDQYVYLPFGAQQVLCAAGPVRSRSCAHCRTEASDAKSSFTTTN